MTDSLHLGQIGFAAPQSLSCIFLLGHVAKIDRQTLFRRIKVSLEPSAFTSRSFEVNRDVLRHRPVILLANFFVDVARTHIPEHFSDKLFSRLAQGGRGDRKSTRLNS